MIKINNVEFEIPKFFNKFFLIFEFLVSTFGTWCISKYIPNDLTCFSSFLHIILIIIIIVALTFAINLLVFVGQIFYIYFKRKKEFKIQKLEKELEDLKKHSIYFATEEEWNESD